MASDQSVDYEAVLADLRSKRDRINAAIEGIETMLGIANIESQDAGGPSDGKHRLGPGAFLGMSIADAAKKYLALKRENQRTEEILNALREGGIVLNGASPINVVGSVLNRNFTNGGDIVKVGRGVWGLAQWHPRLRKKAGATNGELPPLSEDEPSLDEPVGVPSVADVGTA